MKDRRPPSHKKLFPMWLDKGSTTYNNCLVKWRLKGWVLDWGVFEAFGLRLPLFYVRGGGVPGPPRRGFATGGDLVRYVHAPKHDKFRLTNYTDEEGLWIDVAGGTSH